MTCHVHVTYRLNCDAGAAYALSHHQGHHHRKQVLSWRNWKRDSHRILDLHLRNSRAGKSHDYPVRFPSRSERKAGAFNFFRLMRIEPHLAKKRESTFIRVHRSKFSLRSFQPKYYAIDHFTDATQYHQFFFFFFHVISKITPVDQFTTFTMPNLVICKLVDSRSAETSLLRGLPYANVSLTLVSSPATHQECSARLVMKKTLRNQYLQNWLETQNRSSTSSREKFTQKKIKNNYQFENYLTLIAKPTHRIR